MLQKSLLCNNLYKVSWYWNVILLFLQVCQSKICSLISDLLLTKRQSYLLRVFWDFIHWLIKYNLIYLTYLIFIHFISDIMRVLLWRDNSTTLPTLYLNVFQCIFWKHISPLYHDILVLYKGLMWCQLRSFFKLLIMFTLKVEFKK